MKVLVIDSDLNSASQVAEVLEPKGYDVVAAITGQNGLLQAHRERYDLVLIDIALPDADGYEVCRSLRTLPHLAQAPILIHSALSSTQDKVAGFQAGANDYMVKPVAAAELLARVETSLGLVKHPDARIIAVWGSKGGVGTTMVAGNLAVAIRQRTGKRVILVDASVLAGTLDLTLNLPPQHTTSDLLDRIDSLDSELISSVLVEHSSGVRALLSTPWSTNGHGLKSEHLDRILTSLQKVSDYIVIDTAPSLDAATITALQMADRIITVLTPEMTALRNARLFLSMTPAWGFDRGSLLLVLNRGHLPRGIRSKDVQRSLQTRVDLELPNDAALVTQSVNRGIPLVLSHKRSALARQFSRLAETITTGLGEEQAPVASPRRLSLRRLFLRRKD